jgi:hypothetical protein
MTCTELRAVLLSALVLGAVLATLVLTGCGASQRTVARPRATQDGAHRDQSTCERERTQAAHDACLDSLGY